MPCPACLSLPWLTSSSQTSRGYWSGGVIPAIDDLSPELIGPRPIREKSSSCVSLSRFLNALNAALSVSAEGDALVGGTGLLAGGTESGVSDMAIARVTKIAPSRRRAIPPTDQELTPSMVA